MCRIEEQVYLGPDGRRQTFEDTFPCNKACRGRLCSNVKRRTTGYFPKRPTIVLDNNFIPKDNPTSPIETGIDIVELRKLSRDKRPTIVLDNNFIPKDNPTSPIETGIDIVELRKISRDKRPPPSKEKIFCPPREKRPNPGQYETNRPGHTRRRTITQAEFEERERLLLETKAQMAREREAVEQREREERATELRQQQENSSYWDQRREIQRRGISRRPLSMLASAASTATDDNASTQSPSVNYGNVQDNKMSQRRSSDAKKSSSNRHFRDHSNRNENTSIPQASHEADQEEAPEETQKVSNNSQDTFASPTLDGSAPKDSSRLQSVDSTDMMHSLSSGLGQQIQSPQEVTSGKESVDDHSDSEKNFSSGSTAGSHPELTNKNVSEAKLGRVGHMDFPSAEDLTYLKEHMDVSEPEILNDLPHPFNIPLPRITSVKQRLRTAAALEQEGTTGLEEEKGSVETGVSRPKVPEPADPLRDATKRRTSIGEDVSAKDHRPFSTILVNEESVSGQTQNRPEGTPDQDRWAQIRKNAIERAARLSKEKTPQVQDTRTRTDEDEDRDEETIESRVQRIKDRVDELTNNMPSPKNKSNDPSEDSRDMLEADFATAEHDSPSHSSDAPAIQEAKQHEGIERIQHSDEESTTQMLNSRKVWDELSARADFKDGTIDIDMLCSELRAKARASESGVIVEAKDVDPSLQHLPRESQRFTNSVDDEGTNIKTSLAQFSQALNQTLSQDSQFKLRQPQSSEQAISNESDSSEVIDSPKGHEPDDKSADERTSIRRVERADFILEELDGEAEYDSILDHIEPTQVEDAQNDGSEISTQLEGDRTVESFNNLNCQEDSSDEEERQRMKRRKKKRGSAGIFKRSHSQSSGFDWSSDDGYRDSNQEPRRLRRRVHRPTDHLSPLSEVERYLEIQKIIEEDVPDGERMPNSEGPLSTLSSDDSTLNDRNVPLRAANKGHSQGHEHSKQPNGLPSGLIPHHPAGERFQRDHLDSTNASTSSQPVQTTRNLSPERIREYIVQHLSSRFIKTRILEDYIDTHTNEFGARWQLHRVRDHLRLTLKRPLREDEIEYLQRASSPGYFSSVTDLLWDDSQLDGQRLAAAPSEMLSSDDCSSIGSSYAASVLSVQSLASSATDLSKGSGYSPHQIATATKELLSILQRDDVLTPLYTNAIEDPSIGRERLQRNLRRLFKQYAEHLKGEAKESLEYLAARLVSYKASFVAQSIVQQFGKDCAKQGPVREKEDSSKDEDEDEEVQTVDDDVFDDLIIFREFLVGSEAFQTLRAQVKSFVLPKGPLSFEKGTCFEKKCADEVCSDKPAHMTDTKTPRRGPLDLLVETFKGFLMAMGHLEPPLEPGKVRLRWQCGCGDRFVCDVTEYRESGVAQLVARIERSMRTKVTATSYTPGSTSQNYKFQNPLKWLQRALTRLASTFRQPSKPCTLPRHNMTTPCANPGTIPPQQNLLHLLACMHAGRFRKSLYQDRIEDIKTDRELFCFLRKQFTRYRGRFCTLLSLKTVNGIFFVKFRLPRGGSVEVRHHDPFGPLSSCECIPPPDRVEPAPQAEYKCKPGPPDVWPPIDPAYLAHLMNSPCYVDEKDDWILNMLPKRVCGELQGKTGQPVDGWGIYFQEGWDRNIITFVICVLFLAGSSVFGILWYKFELDIQGAFGVSAYMMAACTVIISMDLTE